MSDFVNTVDMIGDEALTDSIIQRTITEIKDNTIAKIGTYAFYGCSNLETVDFPEVVEIGEYGLGDCTSLENINLPKLKTVGGYAFTGTIFKRMAIPNMQTVSANAFVKCYGMEILDLPIATSIGKSAFEKCSALKALILRSETLCTLYSAYVFEESSIESGTGYIYVPSVLVNSYKAASGWSTYASQIRPLEDYTVDDTITGELDETKI